jgi:hypothetical protein
MLTQISWRSVTHRIFAVPRDGQGRKLGKPLGQQWLDPRRNRVRRVEQVEHLETRWSRRQGCTRRRINEKQMREVILKVQLINLQIAE